MQFILLLTAFSACGYAAGLLIARTDASRFVGAGAMTALGVVALRIDTFALFPLAVVLAFAGIIHGRHRILRRRWLLYAPGKGGIELSRQITSSVQQPSNDNSRDAKH